MRGATARVIRKFVAEVNDGCRRRSDVGNMLSLARTKRSYNREPWNKRAGVKVFMARATEKPA